MTKVKVNAGICGFKTTIILYSKKSQLKIKIQSECPDIKKLGKEIQEVNAYNEIFSKISNSFIYYKADKYCKHITCPVPVAILKGIEVASGLALPKDVNIKIQNYD